MTTITFMKLGNRIKITAHDHAYGSEMVCNAVSVMMFSLEAWLVSNPEMVKHHESEFKSGHAEIEFTPIEAEMYTILGFVILALAEIELNYGRDFIALNVSEEIKELTGARF